MKSHSKASRFVVSADRSDVHPEEDISRNEDRLMKQMHTEMAQKTAFKINKPKKWAYLLSLVDLLLARDRKVMKKDVLDSPTRRNSRSSRRLPPTRVAMQK